MRCYNLMQPRHPDSTMKLIGSLTSPYARKARVVLAEKKIDYEFVIDTPWAADTQVSKYNPLGKIPVLVLDDGSTLFDSRVIADYLDSVTPNNRLLPQNSRDRIQIKRWEALADGVCDAAANAFLEAKRPDGERSATWIERQRGKIDLGVQAMAHDLGDRPWCHGKSMTLADVASGCALGYLVFRFPDIAWRDRHTNLAKLYDKLMQRQAFIDTIPQG
jgi:glutathione S-transferase